MPDLNLLESIEQLFQAVGGDADAGIAHGEMHQEGVRTGRHQRRVQGHPARLGELDRVRQQVDQHLLQMAGIAVNPGRHVGCNLELEGKPFCLGTRLQHQVDVPEQFRQREI